MRQRDRLYIGGEWVEPAGRDGIEVVSPHSEQVIASVPDGTDADVDRAVAAARAAFDDGPWPHTPPAERADLMAAISTELKARAPEIAGLISEQNGSPIDWAMLGQVFTGIMTLDYYTDLARGFSFEERRDGLLGPSIVVQQPVGVAAAITPWNMPLFVEMMKIGPALAAGCTMVLKPAPETPLDAFLLADICDQVGLPPGVFNVVSARAEVSESLVRHAGVDKVGFTGSTAVGKRIGAICGEQLKPVTLELGGKSAAIILDDADLGDVMAWLIPGLALVNNGEACCAQTRILAPRERYSEVVEALCEAVRGLRVGDPSDPETQIGPLVTKRQLDRVNGYINLGQEEGAKIAIGGGRPEGVDRGWYVEPTVFVDVDNSMRIAQEEIFGPVVAVIPYADDDEAVRIANDSIYGLSGSVWTRDDERGATVARRVRTGTHTVNSAAVLEVGSPFGGFRQSGIGRELGPEGLRAYLESRSIQMPPGT